MAEANPTGRGQIAKLPAGPSPTKEGAPSESEKLTDEMEDRNGGLITDKKIEALVLLEERTRAIRVRLERIEARLKELEEEDK